MLAQADLRADLFSLFFFSVLLRRLESGRSSFLFGFCLFAVWSNLHAGFPLGFLLYALYGAGAEAAGALFGSLLNPYGLGLYSVLAAHASSPSMARFVMEWGPPSPRNPFQSPLIAAFAVLLIVAWSSRRRVSKRLIVLSLALGAAALASARFGAYFAAAGAALVAVAFPKPRLSAVAAGLAVLTALLVVPVRRLAVGADFDDHYVARRAVDFVVSERDALKDLRLFNQYEWGGYLGWRLGPDGKVFGDGRYLFHDQLAELQDALASPEAMADFAERDRLDGFLIKNYPTTLPSTRVYPDGSSKSIPRPWYISFFPRERWALVYWDDQALVFVRRAKTPLVWLSEHEYRWLLPGDDAARSDALERDEIPLAALRAEESRHRRDVAP